MTERPEPVDQAIEAHGAMTAALQPDPGAGATILDQFQKLAEHPPAGLRNVVIASLDGTVLAASNPKPEEEGER